MIRFGTITLASLLVTLFSGSTDGGIILFTKQISVNRSVNIFDTNQFDVDLGFGNSFSNPTNGVKLFDSLVISPADVGSTFSATAATDPGFAQVAPRLSDGLNEYVKVMLTENQTNGLVEQRGWQENFFFGHVGPLIPPDLLGEQVVEVKLHVDHFFTVTPPPPGGPAALSLSVGPQFDLAFTLQLFGIPEPGTSLLVAIGLATLALRRSHSTAR